MTALPRPAPTRGPLPTPTVAVGFVVQITPVPTHPPRATPVPTATPFKVPRGRPYILLEPALGPPATRTIIVRGGGLPPSSTVALVWTAPEHGAGVGTTAGTSRSGVLFTRFTIPASPPGLYEVLADVNGVQQASARYKVVSMATLTATVSGTAGRETLTMRGVHFLPHLRIVLIAYSVGKSTRATYLGATRTTSSGTVSYTRPERLPTGQYILRAWSASAMSSQMAETVFQVMF